MSESRGVVNQDTYAIGSERQWHGFRVNPRGEAVNIDVYMQWVLDGRVYNISTPVQETPTDLSVAGRGSDNINPSILIDAPSGTTVIPLGVMLMPLTQTGDELINVTINTDDKTRYTSGGNDATQVNMRKDDPQVSIAVAKYHTGSQALVALVDEDDDTLYATQIASGDVPPVNGANIPIIWSARTALAPVLIGPASFLIFLTAASADTLFQWSVKYAVFETAWIT